jgi:hypothetical protein
VHVQEEEPDRLGPAQHPGQVLVSGHATSLEARIFLVGALRALGVPARLSSTREHVDFHDGDRWQTVDPRPALEGDEEEAAGSAAPGTIRLRLTRNGAPLGSDFHGLDVAPFRRGAWIPLRRYAHRLEEDHHVMELPAADYLVTAGVRNANGDAWVRTALVQLEGGQVEALDWSLDLPPDSGLFTFPVVRAIDALPDCSLGEGAEARTLPELATEGPLLLVLVRPGHEPCQRMLPLIDEAHTTWLAPVGTRTLGLLVSAGEGELPGVSFPMVPAPEGLAEALQLSGDDVSLPSVLLLRDGKPLLWQEGYDLEIGTLLQHAARQL